MWLHVIQLRGTYPFAFFGNDVRSVVFSMHTVDPEHDVDNSIVGELITHDGLVRRRSSVGGRGICNVRGRSSVGGHGGHVWNIMICHIRGAGFGGGGQLMMGDRGRGLSPLMGSDVRFVVGGWGGGGCFVDNWFSWLWGPGVVGGGRGWWWH